MGDSNAKKDINLGCTTCEDFPLSLPGINIPEVLERVGGDAALLKRLLLSYRRDYRDVGERVAAAVHASDFDLAARLAHSVKGVSANLGAATVCRAAAELEVVIRCCDEKGCFMALVGFEAELEEVMKSISTLGGDSISSGEAKTDFRIAARASSSRQTVDLIDHGDMSSVDCPQTLMSRCGGSEADTRSQQAAARPGMFDSDRAGQYVEMVFTEMENDPDPIDQLPDSGDASSGNGA